MTRRIGEKLVRQPLYEQVARLLRDEVLAHSAAGDQLAAESALAKQFGVSVMTVREALSALAQEGVIERRHGKGNFVRDCRGGSHVAILNELDLSQPFKPYFFLRVAQAVEKRLTELGLASRHYLGHTRHGEVPPAMPTNEELLRQLEAGHLSAIAGISTNLSPEWRATIREANIPFVGDGLTLDYGAVIDQLDIMERGVAYLAARGCRRVAMFYNLAPWHERSPQEGRFAEALLAHGLANAGALGAFPGDELSGHSAGELFLRLWEPVEGRPDGLLVMDDVLFQEIAFAMLSQGIQITRDIQVITHANKGSNVFGQLPVARLEVDPDAFANGLAELIATLVQGKTPIPKTITLKAVLVDSNCPPCKHTPEEEVSHA